MADRYADKRCLHANRGRWCIFCVHIGHSEEECAVITESIRLLKNGGKEWVDHMMGDGPIKKYFANHGHGFGEKVCRVDVSLNRMYGASSYVCVRMLGFAEFVDSMSGTQMLHELFDSSIHNQVRIEITRVRDESIRYVHERSSDTEAIIEVGWMKHF